MTYSARLAEAGLTYAQLLEQRDGLLAALEAVILGIKSRDHDLGLALVQARAAIAKAKGET